MPSLISDTAIILTVVGFGLTVWQLVVVNNRLKNVEAETKRRYKSSLDLIKITETLSLIHFIQDDLTLPQGQLMTGDRIKLIIVRLQVLNDFLKDTQNDYLVKHYGRADHNRLVSTISSDINRLRTAFHDDPAAIDTRFIYENLQSLRDSIKLIETHLDK